MPNAIVTKHRAPTNHHGARILATSGTSRAYVAYDYGASVEQNHERAAAELARKLGVEFDRSAWSMGTMPDCSGFAFVRAEPHACNGCSVLARM